MQYLSGVDDVDRAILHGQDFSRGVDWHDACVTEARDGRPTGQPTCEWFNSQYLTGAGSCERVRRDSVSRAEVECRGSQDCVAQDRLNSPPFVRRREPLGGRTDVRVDVAVRDQLRRSRIALKHPDRVFVFHQP
jgi:hypothetical protein